MTFAFASRLHMPMCNMDSNELSRADFERAATEALDSLPERFAALVQNVVIAIEDEPSAEDLKIIDRNGEGATELLGIYRGVALTERGAAAPLLPDQIALFRGPINRVSRTPQEALGRVRDTMIHELGHYFDLDDDAMPH